MPFERVDLKPFEEEQGKKKKKKEKKEVRKSNQEEQQQEGHVFGKRRVGLSGGSFGPFSSSFSLLASTEKEIDFIRSGGTNPAASHLLLPPLNPQQQEMMMVRVEENNRYFQSNKVYFLT